MYYISEFIGGGIITATFSYAASFYHSEPSYIKIIAFLWGIPLLYFYILYIAWQTDKQAAIDVTRHGLLWNNYYYICYVVYFIYT